MLRAMHLEFPDDPACDSLDRQYLLGGALLVAPVLTEDGVTRYYLPEGRWTHLLTGEVQTGGRWQEAQHDFLSLPLFVRPNTLLPFGAVEDRPDYDYAEGVTLAAYELAEDAELEVEIPSHSGGAASRAKLSRSRTGVRVEFVEGTPKTWSLLLAGVSAASAIRGATAQTDPRGLCLRATGAGAIEFSIAGR
jgi:alpha-D-xyloside xylohydrolase